MHSYLTYLLVSDHLMHIFPVLVRQSWMWVRLGWVHELVAPVGSGQTKVPRSQL